MSNAMRFGKRSLAGVAAGALALGMLTIASAPAASAKPSIKPKTTSVVQGTVTPVRVTLSPAALVEAVPYASVTWTPTTTTLGGSETVTVTLNAAPSPNAVLGIANAVNAAAGAQAAFSTTSGGTFTNQWDTAILGQAADASSSGIAGVNGATTGRLGFAANESGTYSGIISVNGVGGTPANVNNVNFTFTTTGRATSLTLSPATASTTLGGVTNLTAELKDAAGNRTQPLWVDSLSLTNTGGSTTPTATVSASDLRSGTATIAYAAPSAAAGSYSVTAAPAGTLASGGVTAQTSVITVSGAIAETVPFGIGVLNPTDAINSPTTVTNATGTVPSGTSNITVAIDGGTARLGAGQTLRFSLTAPTGGTVNGASTATVAQFATVTLDANGDGTFSFVLGGQALVNGQNTTVRQVKANGDNVTSGALLTVAQETPAVGNGTIYPSPSGNLVAALGATTSVQVAVENQFEDPQPGFTVRAFRGSNPSTGTLLSSGVTNADGVAAVTVSQSAAAVAGTVETYSFQVQAPGGTINNATATLVITYTAGGNISGLTATSTPAVSTTAAVVTSQALITVPSSGIVTGAQTTSTFNPATGTATGASTAGTFFAISVSTTPATNVTLTAPTGAKLVTDIPTTDPVLWSGGKSSVTVASPSTVYVFATKTGNSAIQVTANQLTTSVPFTVTNQATDYYNMSITPATQDISSGAFGTATVTVTDIFGNPVQTTGGPVTVTATGEVLLSGLTASQTINTGASGTATLTLIAGARAGLGKVSIAPTLPLANAWAASYVPPRGAPNPIKSGSADVVIKEVAERTLIIAGERTTVSGKPGIRVEGEADNFENGAKVKPWIRFPGETSYSEGSARPAVTDEQFSWQRKTGKKIYVYFTSEDGTIQSNRVIIAAN